MTQWVKDPALSLPQLKLQLRHRFNLQPSSVLRIWHCFIWYCYTFCGVGRSCGSDSVPGLGTSTCHGYRKKKKKKQYFNIIVLRIFPPVSCEYFHTQVLEKFLQPRATLSPPFLLFISPQSLFAVSSVADVIALLQRCCPHPVHSRLTMEQLRAIQALHRSAASKTKVLLNFRIFFLSWPPCSI